MIRLGIMGGTFDPPHLAHLIMAEKALHEYNLDNVLFIPSGNPPHKTCNDVTSAEDRYSMTLLSISSNPNFYISRIEIDRVGLSYSIDTIEELRGIYGANTELYFIIGMDEALNIKSWHRADELPKVVRFIIAPRPGYNSADIRETLPDAFSNAFDLLSMQPVYISSTNLREMVSESKSIRYMVTDLVNEYILKHNLYKQGANK